MKYLVMALIMLFLQACSDSNEHFCAKYSFYYKQLLEPGLPPYSDMKKQLKKEIANNTDKNAKIALFVLEDFKRSSKPKNEDPKDFCQRRQLWQRYGG